MNVNCNEVAAGVSLAVAGGVLIAMGVLTVVYNFAVVMGALTVVNNFAVACVLIAAGASLFLLGVYWVILVFSEATGQSQEIVSGYELFSSPCSRKISITSSKGDELYDILWSHPTKNSATVNIPDINLSTCKSKK